MGTIDVKKYFQETVRLVIIMASFSIFWCVMTVIFAESLPSGANEYGDVHQTSTSFQ